MFRHSICDPFEMHPIEMGDIEREKVMDVLNGFLWTELLDKMNETMEKDIHFSPSLEFENTTTRHGLSMSIVEDDSRQEFYIFYKRPKMVSTFLGLMTSMDDHYLTERTGQSIADARDAVTALIGGDYATLKLFLYHWVALVTRFEPICE